MIDNHLYSLIIKIFYTLFQFYEQEYQGSSIRLIIRINVIKIMN